MNIVWYLDRAAQVKSTSYYLVVHFGLLTYTALYDCIN